MRLKKLQLFGFKSFADKTEILFDEGVTCIVGPNGCGKSNISDSIRWVLGERSAKLLRGTRMEDVIFSGTDFRKPIGMAEVSLTIDNSDRGLPIDYQEVTLTRRLYRSGESEYLINKTVCRLKDIQDLILDTGIGSNSYSMIEQGRIDYILNADPQERRFLIEEAAGISKYKVKKEEAIRKLERTVVNLERLDDIIHEVHKNIQYAERQAKRAHRYKEKFEELKKLEITKAFHELKNLESHKYQIESDCSAQKMKLSELEKRVLDVRTQQENLKETLYDIINRFSGEEGKRYQIQSKMEQNEQQLVFHQEKRIEISGRRGQIQEEKKHLEERIEKNGHEIASKSKELEDLSQESQKAFETREESKKQFCEMEARWKNQKNDLEKIRQDAFQAASELSRLRNEFHRLQAILDSQDGQKRKQAASMQKLNQEVSEWKSKKENWESEIRALETVISDSGNTADGLKNRSEDIRSRCDAMKVKADDLVRSIQGKEARFKILTELEETSKANSDIVLEGLSETQRALICSLRDVIKVHSGYEWALDTALHAYSKSLVVENHDTATELLNKVQEFKSAPFGFFIKSATSAASPPFSASHPNHHWVRCSLCDVIEMDPSYQHLFDDLLKDVFIVNCSVKDMIHEPSAFQEGFKYITPEGVILGPGGHVFYQNGKLSENYGFFKRKSEIESLKNEIVQIKILIHREEQNMEHAQEELEKIISEDEMTKSKIQEALIQKESFESLCREMEEHLEGHLQELNIIEIESQELNENRDTFISQKRICESNLNQAEERERFIHSEQERLHQELDEFDRQKNDALKIMAEQEARFNHIDDRRKILEESLQDHRERDQHDRDRIVSLDCEWNSLEGKEEKLIEEDVKIRGEQGILDSSRQQVDVSLELIRQEREKAERELSESHEKMQEVLKSEQGFREEIHQLEMNTMDLNYRQKTIFERLQQTYRIQLSDLNPDDYSFEGDFSLIEQSIEKLQSIVESLGTVNLLAIEEYDDLKQRYDFLVGQQKDLQDARQSLLETIRKINRTTKDLFEKTFVNVQETFHEYFSILFQGGMAKMVLLDEQNPLESGIDIMVRPPGKKLQNISLLSGGEKALTAIALLFALFKIKPSPFCVLDEVDAPLDEANIDRFIGVLREFLSVAQFILVTHNRKTIAMGDSLYGVTMEEAGVSKIVSVKVTFDENSIPSEETEQIVEENIHA